MNSTHLLYHQSIELLPRMAALSAEQLSELCCFGCHLLSRPGHAFLVQVQVVSSSLAAALKPLAEPTSATQVGGQAGSTCRGSNGSRGSRGSTSGGFAECRGHNCLQTSPCSRKKECTRHHPASGCAAPKTNPVFWRGCKTVSGSTTRQCTPLVSCLLPCWCAGMGAFGRAYCASPLSSSSYTSSFFAKSPCLRGSTWMCTCGTVCPAAGPSCTVHCGRTGTESQSRSLLTALLVGVLC